MATTTPNVGFSKPATTDTVDVTVLNADWDIADNQFSALVGTGHDHRTLGAPVARVSSGLFAARPAPSAAGQIYAATDALSLGALYVSDGVIWRPASYVLRQQMFGNAALGTVTIGANTTLNVLSSYADLTVSSGFTLSARMPIFVQGTLTVNGTISPEAPATASATTSLVVGGAGGAAGSGAGAVGSSATVLPGGIGSAGGAGGASGANSGGAGGAVTRFVTPGDAGIWFLPALFGAGNVFGRPLGGGGGGAGGGDGTNNGGAGGIGGGALVIYAYNVVIGASGIIAADGGVGAAGAAGNAAGGGGGGGGAVIIVFHTLTSSGVIRANGGAQGAGVGTGAAGTAGTAGLTRQIQLGV